MKVSEMIEYLKMCKQDDEFNVVVACEENELDCTYNWCGFGAKLVTALSPADLKLLNEGITVGDYIATMTGGSKIVLAVSTGVFKENLTIYKGSVRRLRKKLKLTELQIESAKWDYYSNTNEIVVKTK